MKAKALHLAALVALVAFGVVGTAIAGVGGPDTQSVPEPATMALVAAGVAGLYLVKRHRR